MKKIVLGVVLGILILALVGIVAAIPNPAPVYCENMNYTANETHCIFNDNKSCELWDFLNGECGEEYVIDFPCRQEGESISPGYGCCEGLTEIGHATIDASGTCQWKVGAWSICAPCGNGICDNIENKCACPEDCEGDNQTQNNQTNNNVTDQNQTRVRNRVKERVLNYLNASECPEDCVCAGSTIKCDIDGVRTMTVVAGRSGNIIIKTKGVNASTQVKLIKNESGVFGNFTRAQKKIMKKLKFMPDQIKERVLKKLKMRNCTDCNITLNEDGTYEVRIQRRYRVFGIFPKKITEVAEVDSDTGEVIKLKRPWWKFLAAKNKE